MVRRSLATLLSLATAGLVLTANSCVDNAPWRGWGGGVGNRFAAVSDSAQGILRWVSQPADHLGPNVGCPILWAGRGAGSWTDARIFIGNSAGALTERLPLNDNLVSSFLAIDGVVGCPSAPYDQVLFSTSGGKVVALVAASMPLKAAWQADLGLGSVLPTSPTSDGSSVFVAAEHFLFALAVADGSVRWRRDLGDTASPIAAPALSVLGERAHVVVSTLQGHVEAFDSGTGAPLWDHPIPNEPLNQGVAIGISRTVYVASFTGRVHALDPDDGHEVWSFDTGAGHPLLGPAVAFRGNQDWIYFADTTSALYVLDAAGALVRKESLPGLANSVPVVGPDDVVYLSVGSAGSAAVIALAAQSQVWSVSTSGPARFLAVGVNGDVYAASLSALHAIR